MADKSSTTGNNPFFVVDKPFPELFASLTERVGPIHFATVTDTGSLVTFEIPVEVVGINITSTLGPQAAFDGDAVVLRTTFDPTVGGEPVLEFELVGPSIDPGFDALRFWDSSAPNTNISPDTQLGRPQLSMGSLTALETDLVPGVTILTSEPDLVIELFFDGTGFVSLTNLGPDVPFAVIRMITAAVSSLPSPGPFDFGLGTVTTTTATSTVGTGPELEPDLPTSTATSTVGTGPELEPDTDLPTDTGFTLDTDPELDDPDSCDDDPGPMCDDDHKSPLPGFTLDIDPELDDPDSCDDTDLPTDTGFTLDTDPEAELEPGTTYMVIVDGNPTATGFTLDIDPEHDDPDSCDDTDLPTDTGFTLDTDPELDDPDSCDDDPGPMCDDDHESPLIGFSAGIEPDPELDDPDSCDDDPGPMCEDPPPRRSAIKLVMIGGVIVVTLVGASVGVWALGSSGGRNVASDGGGQVLVDTNTGPQDPPPSSIIPASSTSSTSSTTVPPSSSSTSSTSTSSTSSTTTSSTSSTSTSSTSSTSTSSTTISILPPPTSSDAPPASSTSSTTTSSNPPVSSTSSTTTTPPTTTPPTTTPPTTTPRSTSKSSGAQPIVCSDTLYNLNTSWIDVYIPIDAISPNFSYSDPPVCATPVTVTSELIASGGSGTSGLPAPTPPSGKKTFRVIFETNSATTPTRITDSVKLSVTWTYP